MSDNVKLLLPVSTAWLTIELNATLKGARCQRCKRGYPEVLLNMEAWKQGHLLQCANRRACDDYLKEKGASHE
jgi:hypothetical protein